MKRRPQRTRAVAATVAGALVLSLAQVSGIARAADQLPPLADPVADGAFCDGASGDNPFNDLDAESASTREVILCLVDTGLTKGTSPTTYSPGGSVTRRQMALFVKRLADLMNELERSPLEDLPAYDGVPDHPDVVLEDEDVQEAVGQLGQAEIVQGFPDGTYRPAAQLSRRQMAAFVNRLEAFLTGQPFSTDADYFDDDDGDSGEDDLNALASVGIFQGDRQGHVFPGARLTRRQMANILLRYAQVHHADGSVSSPFRDEPVGPPDTTRPTSDFAKMTTVAGLPDVFDAGDVVTIVFSEEMLPPSPSATITLYDTLPGASAATITNGVTATFSLNQEPVTVAGVEGVRPARSVLTVTLLNEPQPASIDPELSVPATISGATGITDPAFLTWHVSASADTTVER